jgi:hypothetical protein
MYKATLRLRPHTVRKLQGSLDGTNTGVENLGRDISSKSAAGKVEVWDDTKRVYFSETGFGNTDVWVSTCK